MVIVSIEGSRSSGKTFLKEILKRNFPDAEIIPPPSMYAALVEDTPPSSTSTHSDAVRVSQAYFLAHTIDKFALARDPRKLYLMDRDFLSLLAFAYAQTKHSGIDVYTPMDRAINSGLEEGVLRVPELRLVCDANVATILRRSHERKKPMEPLWYDSSFLSQILGFFRSSVERNPYSVLLKENFTEEDVIPLISQRLSFERI